MTFRYGKGERLTAQQLKNDWRSGVDGLASRTELRWGAVHCAAVECSDIEQCFALTWRDLASRSGLEWVALRWSGLKCHRGVDWCCCGPVVLEVKCNRVLSCYAMQCIALA